MVLLFLLRKFVADSRDREGQALLVGKSSGLCLYSWPFSTFFNHNVFPYLTN